MEGIFNTWNSQTKQMSKIQLVQQITVSFILLCPTHYCVQEFSMLSKIQYPQMLLYSLVQLSLVDMLQSYHAAVISCFSLHSPLFISTLRQIFHFFSKSLMKCSFTSGQHFQETIARGCPCWLAAVISYYIQHSPLFYYWWD